MGAEKDCRLYCNESTPGFKVIEDRLTLKFELKVNKVKVTTTCNEDIAPSKVDAVKTVPVEAALSKPHV